MLQHVVSEVSVSILDLAILKFCYILSKADTIHSCNSYNYVQGFRVTDFKSGHFTTDSTEHRDQKCSAAIS